MDSLINYLGGKSTLSKKIVNNLPNHKCFVDLFGGAAWILLAKDRSASKVEVYNDIDSSMVNMFEVIKHPDDHRELISKFENLLVSREIFNKIKEMKRESSSDVDWAFRQIYLCKWSFSGRRSSDNSYSFGYSKKRYPYPSDKIGNHISELYDRLKTTYIENLDYVDVITKYDDVDSLFIIDPPYIIPNVNTNYYKHNMNKEVDHVLLEKNIQNLKGKCIITLPDTDFYRDLYKSYRIENTSLNYSVGNLSKSQGNRGEILIFNYN